MKQLVTVQVIFWSLLFSGCKTSDSTVSENPQEKEKWFTPNMYDIAVFFGLDKDSNNYVTYSAGDTEWKHDTYGTASSKTSTLKAVMKHSKTFDTREVTIEIKSDDSDWHHYEQKITSTNTHLCTMSNIHFRCQGGNPGSFSSFEIDTKEGTYIISSTDQFSPISSLITDVTARSIDFSKKTVGK